MRFALKPVVAAMALAFAAPAFAQFSPGPNPITGTVGAQTLTSGTGTVNMGGAISVGGGTTALQMSGTSTLVNNGTIQATGSGRAIDSNSGIASLNLTNAGLISSNSTDAFRVNTNSAVTLVNSGTIQVTNGGQAIDWAAITSASNMLTNQSGGLISAVGEDAVRPGQNGIVNNAGTIIATPTGVADPSGSDGIDLRTQKTVTVNNTGTITGRHGIATDGANVGPSSLTLFNNAGTIQAISGSGVNVDGANVTVTANITNALGATIKGGVSVGATNGDGDGIDVDGILTLNNSGMVLGLGARGAGNNAEGVAAGGGSITNTATGQIIGKSNAPNGDLTRAGSGILIDDSNGGNAVAATTVTNSGLIQGETGFAIKLIGTFADTVTNNAGGTIHGHAAGVGTGAALQTGGGADTVINRGALIGGNGSALDLEGGNDTLRIEVAEGGAASITGNVSGGAGTDAIIFDLGLGNDFTYSGLASSFETVEAKSGLATIVGANRIDSTSTLVLSGGAFGIVAGGPNGQTFASLMLSANSGIDLNRSTSVTFNDLGAVASGTTLAIVDYDFADSPDYVIRFLGNLTTDPDFLALIGMTTIDGRIATSNFDGTFTNVTVPEPSTLAVMGLGMVLLGFRARRSSRRRIKDEA